MGQIHATPNPGSRSGDLVLVEAPRADHAHGRTSSNGVERSGCATPARLPGFRGRFTSGILNWDCMNLQGPLRSASDAQHDSLQVRLTKPSLNGLMSSLDTSVFGSSSCTDTSVEAHQPAHVIIKTPGCINAISDRGRRQSLFHEPSSSTSHGPGALWIRLYPRRTLYDHYTSCQSLLLIANQQGDRVEHGEIPVLQYSFHPYPDMTPGVLQIIPIPTGLFTPRLPGPGKLWSAMPIPPQKDLYGRGPILISTVSPLPALSPLNEGYTTVQCGHHGQFFVAARSARDMLWRSLVNIASSRSRRVCI